MYAANPAAFQSLNPNQPQSPVIPYQPPNLAPIIGNRLATDASLANSFLFGNGGVPPLPARPAAAAPSPVMMMATTSNPTQFSGQQVGPQPPVMQMQPIPVGPGANISPLSLIPVSQPAPVGAYGSPYGDVGAALQQQDAMDYMYGR
jgi:hypothetical protein